MVALRLATDVSREVAKNIAMAIPPLRAWRLTRSRSGTVEGGDDAFLERYALQATRHLRTIVPTLHELHIVEIGPGDYLTSGLALLAAGAASYTALDRFPGPYEGETARHWYRKLQTAWPRLMPDTPWPADLDAATFPEAYRNRVTTLRDAVEDVALGRKYDVVCSYQVGEHVSDIGAFAAINARLLGPGGVGAHRVDMAAHPPWHDYPDPFQFLRFPDWLWQLMGSHRGTSNRHRHHEFCEAFRAAGLTVESSLEPYRDEDVDTERLPARYRRMPSESLRVAAATYVVRPNG